MSDLSNRPDVLEEIREKHRALAILRLLDQSPGYTLNLEVLRDCLGRVALACGRDELVEQCHALERVRFVGIEVVSGVTVLKLSEQGREVAQGIVLSDMVERPGPGCPY